MEINEMKTVELKQLLSDVTMELAHRSEGERKEARRQIKAIAAEHGIDLTKMLGEKSAKPKVAPKYRNADGQEWTGRGRQPLWLVGQDRENFKIAA